LYWWRSYKVLLLALSLFGVGLIFSLIPAYGDELDQIKAQQKKVQQQMERQKQALLQKEKEKKTFQGQLAALEMDMEEVKEDIESLEKQLKTAEGQVQQAEKELEQTQADLDKRTEIFKKRIREVYINGQVSYLEVAFQAASVSDFLMRFDLLEKLVEQDVEMLHSIEMKKDEVTQKKAELEQQRNKIAEIKRSTENQRQKLADRQEEKRRLLQTVDQEKAAAEKALDELEQLSQDLSEKIKKIQAERQKRSNNHFGGVFSWPTPGYTRITSDYGMRLHPITKTNRMHTGIDIGAPAGASIQAADAGTVIYCGLLGAYGNVVVIDHGDGISSMYAHQSKILVSENQQVERGEVIGKVGSTGWSTGPHLHFEVRKDGDPVNPWSYLK